MRYDERKRLYKAEKRNIEILNSLEIALKSACFGVKTRSKEREQEGRERERKSVLPNLRRGFASEERDGHFPRRASASILLRIRSFRDCELYRQNIGNFFFGFVFCFKLPFF